MQGFAPADDDSRAIAGGSIPGAPGSRAFTLAAGEPSPIPILIAVPHAGRAYPAELIGRMRDHAQAALRLEDRYVDLIATAVARETGAALLVAQAPRAIIDLNRSVDDMDWEMLANFVPAASGGASAGRRARGGLGLVPRRLPGVGEIWKGRMDRAELDRRIGQIHQPYHAALELALRRLRDRWGAALLLDLHSMPPLGRPGAADTPHFVLGDRFGASCAGALCAAAFDEFARRRFKAAHNRPYAGGYVLDRHASPAQALHALQLEVCRSTYLDSRLAEPGAGLDRMVEVLTGLVRRLAGEVAGLGRARQMPLAAE